jgi:vancomycin permeability regulator SanA
VLKMLSVFILIVIIIGITTFIVPRILTGMYARSRVYSVSDTPETPVAIVFGAGLWHDGTPTPVLRDRVATAVDLYLTGKVEKLLMSGDNRVHTYNEPGAMRDYAIRLGVPEEDIVLDYAGWRTYDTCYRAREIFGLEEAILVTQGFHLPRALYTCNSLGISADGVPADRREYRKGSRIYWNLREIFATNVAMWEVHVSHPIPVLGKQEPIFPREAQ